MTNEVYARIAELERENAELRKNAERYRWLRKNSVFSWDKGDDLALVVPGDTNSYNYEDDADVAIDAAMASEKEIPG